jgi:hypothetical protein
MSSMRWIAFYEIRNGTGVGALPFANPILADCCKLSARIPRMDDVKLNVVN